jgi:hypothetical protein
MVIMGVIRGMDNTYVGTGLEQLAVHVKKTEAKGLPFEEEQRVPITLIFSGKAYQAGIRARPDYDFVWICPDVIDTEASKTNLAQIFSDTGFEKNQKVELMVSGSFVMLTAIGS